MNVEYLTKVLVYRDMQIAYFSYEGKKSIIAFSRGGLPAIIHTDVHLLEYKVGDVTMMAINTNPRVLLYQVVEGLQSVCGYIEYYDLLIQVPCKQVNIAPHDTYALFTERVDVWSDGIGGHVGVFYRTGETYCEYRP